jgi:hypothetical protein
MSLIYRDETCWTEPEREACLRESMAIADALTR